MWCSKRCCSCACLQKHGATSWGNKLMINSQKCAATGCHTLCNSITQEHESKNSRRAKSWSILTQQRVLKAGLMCVRVHNTITISQQHQNVIHFRIQINQNDVLLCTRPQLIAQYRWRENHLNISRKLVSSFPPIDGAVGVALVDHKSRTGQQMALATYRDKYFSFSGSKIDFKTCFAIFLGKKIT